MRYTRLKQLFGEYPVFSLDEVRAVEPAFGRRRLSEWQEKGYIRKLVRGYYTFADQQMDETVMFEIANRIYKPSYVSLEMALSYYGLIPEAVYSVTSVSTRRTYRFRTCVAEFIYRTVRPELFFGYRLTRHHQQRCFRMALPAKALLDWLYLNPGISGEDDFGSVRFNPETFFERLHRPELLGMCERFGNRRLASRVGSLWRFMENA
jgi:predicted transcriptional regulator of viral defense system